MVMLSNSDILLKTSPSKLVEWWLSQAVASHTEIKQIITAKEFWSTTGILIVQSWSHKKNHYFLYNLSTSICLGCKEYPPKRAQRSQTCESHRQEQVLIKGRQENHGPHLMCSSCKAVWKQVSWNQWVSVLAIFLLSLNRDHLFRTLPTLMFCMYFKVNDTKGCQNLSL